MGKMIKMNKDTLNIEMGYDRLFTYIAINNNPFIGIDISHIEKLPIFDYIVECNGKTLYLK